MYEDFWQKQTDKPLYPEILWEKPETKARAGKLLIVGGNSHGFQTVAQAYQVALSAGAGEARVVLPDSVKKLMPEIPPHAEFLPSTKTGSFSNEGLNELLGYSQWADAVLISGELGRNSQTALLLESFLEKRRELTALTKDAVDYTYLQADKVLQNPDMVLVASLSQLQKILVGSSGKWLIKFEMTLPQLVEKLHEITSEIPALLITQHHQQIILAQNGQIITQAGAEREELWQLDTAVKAAVFAMQQPQKRFQAIATSLIE